MIDTTTVGFLTRVLAKRRETVLLLCVFAPFGAAANDWQPVGEIGRTAEAYLLEKAAADGATSVRAGSLDERLKLHRCDQPLEGFLRPGTRIGARTSVGVRCTGSRPWKVYVPVEVVVERRVWVAREALPRGHVLGAGDLVADVRDVSRMTASGYISDPALLVGHKLKASVLAGRVLTRQLVEADTLIRRGQTVTLAVSAGGISIRMAGKALSDGARNQRIRVENLNSGRVVEGIVRSPELVEVLVPATTDFFHSPPKVSAPTADTGY
ncbi:MAG: flagellar basal body P-ring formation chaperone FlgA [Woeseiaceae bacterium]|nr:flagellar basal body P-ring formation chaperone FlgA [Woeseiaceae bacterium]